MKGALQCTPLCPSRAAAAINPQALMPKWIHIAHGLMGRQAFRDQTTCREPSNMQHAKTCNMPRHATCNMQALTWKYQCSSLASEKSRSMFRSGCRCCVANRVRSPVWAHQPSVASKRHAVPPYHDQTHAVQPPSCCHCSPMRLITITHCQIVVRRHADDAVAQSSR